MMKVIDGGKTSAAGGSGGAGGNGGGGGTTGASGGSPFEWHPLAEALFDAVYPKDAKTFEQVRERMSRIERRRVTHEETGRTIRHVRDHEDEYGWTIPPIQKGSGKYRRYWATLVQTKDNDSTITADHLQCFDYGMISAVRTIATQTRHILGAAEIVAESSGLTRGQRRQYRAFAAMLASADAIAQQLLNEATG